MISVYSETSSLKVLQRNVREQLDLLRDKTFVIQDKSLLQTITTKLTAINKEVPASSFIQNKCTDAPIGKRKSLSLRKKKKNRHIFYEGTWSKLILLYYSLNKSSLVYINFVDLLIHFLTLFVLMTHFFARISTIS